MTNLNSAIDSMFELKSPNMLVPQMRLSLALNQRKIFLYDDVEEDSIFECIYYLNRIIDIDNRTGEKPPIDIFINSNGGSVYDCFSLISMIEKMKDDGYEIRTINAGKAFSAGFIISIVGSKRISYRYSSYMVHDVSTISKGSIQTIVEDIEESKRLREIINGIIYKYTNISKEDLENWQARKIDKFFSAKEALDLKITDEVM